MTFDVYVVIKFMMYLIVDNVRRNYLTLNIHYWHKEKSIVSMNALNVVYMYI